MFDTFTKKCTRNYTAAYTNKRLYLAKLHVRSGEITERRFDLYQFESYYYLMSKFHIILTISRKIKPGPVNIELTRIY